MKTMIKSLIVLMFIVGTINVFAQQDNRKPPSVEKRVNVVIIKIEKKIDLTETQKRVVMDAYSDFFNTIDEFRKSEERPEKSVIEKHEKVRDHKIKAILSEEKYEDYLSMSRNLRPHPKHKGERPPNQNKILD